MYKCINNIPVASWLGVPPPVPSLRGMGKAPARDQGKSGEIDSPPHPQVGFSLVKTIVGSGKRRNKRSLD